jgi:TP901 family phage tail tape measure protein
MAANQVNVALREDLGDEALTALSKFTEVMGLIPKLGVEKAMLKTGSAIFKLAATSTASAGPIINFSKRLTGVARTAGITTDQILALGSAADSMMLMPEVASTAFSKLITSLQRNPKAIEKSLEMKPGTINDLFKSGNAMQAIVQILQAMHDKGNMHALNDVFKDLGSDGARLISVMVTMAKNVKMLEEHLQESQLAFQSGMAVTQEYLIQQETAQALMERASNLWEKAFINPDGVDNVKEFAKAWYDVSKALTTSEGSMAAFNGIIKTILWLINTLIRNIPAILIALGTKGLLSLLIGLKTALFGVGETALVASIKARGFVNALKAMKAAMVTNWITAFLFIATELIIFFKDFGK